MDRCIYITAIKANDSRLIELEETRRNLFRSMGIASAYAFEAVIPFSIGDHPQEKGPFLPYAKKVRGSKVLPLEFGPLASCRGTLFFPLRARDVYDNFQSLAVSRESMASTPLGHESPKALPGIFIAAGNAEEPKPDTEIPKPWKSYKLAEYRLEWDKKGSGQWWRNCRWEEVWELSIRRT